MKINESAPGDKGRWKVEIIIVYGKKY